MEKAIRVVSIERGRDPRHFALVAFGGAGGLHACALAEALSIPHVIVPALPGALSALGILDSDVVKDYSRTVLWRVDRESSARANLAQEFAALEKSAARDFRSEAWQGTPHYQRTIDSPLPRPGIRTEFATHDKSAERFRTRTPPPLRLHPSDSRGRISDAPPPRGCENAEAGSEAGSCGDGRISAAQAEQSSASFPLPKPPVIFDGKKLNTKIYAREELQPGKKYPAPPSSPNTAPPRSSHRESVSKSTKPQT